MPTIRRSCVRCGVELHPERVEYGYAFCVPCIEAEPRLMATTAFKLAVTNKSSDIAVPLDGDEECLRPRDDLSDRTAFWEPDDHDT